MNTTPKTAPPEISKKLAEVTLGALGANNQVALVADTNHFRLTETVGAVTQKEFWDAIKATGKKPVFATELLMPEHQPIIDAVAQGKITKEEFLGIMAGAGNTGQITKEEQLKIMSDIADMAKSGVRVVGINNTQSMGGEAKKKANSIGIQMELDNVGEWRKKEADFKSNPLGVISQMLDESYAKLDTMGQQQRIDFLKDSAAVLKKVEMGVKLTKEDFDRLAWVGHPNYNEFEINRLAAKDPALNQMDYKLRAEKDDEVVRSIQKETSDPDAIVIVSYGGTHIAGLYDKLNRAEVKTAPPIVPYLGPDHFKCLKPGNDMCQQVEGADKEIRQAIEVPLKNVPHIKIPNVYDM